MRISDWSSYVCSSDLRARHHPRDCATSVRDERFARCRGCESTVNGEEQRCSVSGGAVQRFVQAERASLRCQGGHELSRSYEPLTKADLKRLGEIAADDRADLFRRKPKTAHLYGARLLAVARCQGGAHHYLAGEHRITHLDVGSF